ncbi:ATPase [Colletotrichum graminicola]|nr:ATPase [Colletotrichum graminicola]
MDVLAKPPCFLTSTSPHFIFKTHAAARIRLGEPFPRCLQPREIRNHLFSVAPDIRDLVTWSCLQFEGNKNWPIPLPINKPFFVHSNPRTHCCRHIVVAWPTCYPHRCRHHIFSRCCFDRAAAGKTLSDPPHVDNMEPKTHSVKTAATPMHQAKYSVNTNNGKKRSHKQRVKNPSKRERRKHNRHPRHSDGSSAPDTNEDNDQFANDDGSSDSESLLSDSEDEMSQRKTKSKRHPGATTAKKSRPIAFHSTRKSKASKRSNLSPSPSSSSSETDSNSSSDDDDDDDGLTKVSMTAQQMQLFQHWQRSNGTLPLGGDNGPAFWPPPPRRGGSLGLGDAGLGENPMFGNGTRARARATPPSSKKKSKLDFKRVDQVWDSAIHQYKLQDTAASTSETQYSGYVLQVRRTFDWEGKYKATVVDVKSKLLREVLQEVMGNIKGVSLVDETPKIDPNMLFLYLEDFRKFDKQLKKSVVVSADKKERKKRKKHIKTKRQHLKVLLKYVDKDYAHVKKSLYPMLENGLITFELLWALFKPNTLVYTTTYGSPDEPRVFKVEQAEKLTSVTKGGFYWIDGKLSVTSFLYVAARHQLTLSPYLEFDGKRFGYGTLYEKILEFRGARKITSLCAFPLDFHKDKGAVEAALIDRGKRFVQLGGVH